MKTIRKKISGKLSCDPLWWNRVPEGLFPAVDIGCGNHKAKGSWGIDIRLTPEVDIICDINEKHLPLKDSVVKLLYASHIIEHVEDVEKTLNEIHRVCEDGAQVLIRYPHFRSINAYSDITHKRYLGLRVFDKYTIAHKKAYERLFILKNRGVRLKKWLRRIGVELLLSKVLVRIEGWAFFLPFTNFDVFVHLEVVKKNT
jgi:SAM-dependent methyltransferase